MNYSITAETLIIEAATINVLKDNFIMGYYEDRNLSARVSWNAADAGTAFNSLGSRINSYEYSEYNNLETGMFSTTVSDFTTDIFNILNTYSENNRDYYNYNLNSTTKTMGYGGGIGQLQYIDKLHTRTAVTN